MTPNKQSKHAQVASLIKKELQTRYPLIQWRVKSAIFAGGDSVDVSYTDGPTSHDVQTICDKYVNSSFDAMTDCSNYMKPSYGGDGVRFAMEARHYSKEATDASRARLVALYHLEGLSDNDAIPDNWRVGGYYCLDQLIGHELQDRDLYPKVPKEVSEYINEYVIKPSAPVCLIPEPTPQINPIAASITKTLTATSDPPEDIKFVVGK